VLRNYLTLQGVAGAAVLVSLRNSSRSDSLAYLQQVKKGHTSMRVGVDFLGRRLACRFR
jgi:hypothetical protein